MTARTSPRIKAFGVYTLLVVFASVWANAPDESGLYWIGLGCFSTLCAFVVAMMTDWFEWRAKR